MTDRFSVAPSVPLSVAMRTGSLAEHRAAEGSSFVTHLLEGRINESGYVAYLARLRGVYAALEESGRLLADDPVAAAVLDRGLERSSALENDLAYWSDRAGQAVPAVPDECPYVDRVRSTVGWSGLFVAHHYTRYLGDLSGGQAFAAALRREYGASPRGLAFYAFADVPKPKLYKDAYRERLDALPLGPVGQARVVAEVRTAFRLNQQLFDDLGRDWPARATPAAG